MIWPKKKIILDLCGGTGAWSKPYAEKGYDVRNITLPDYDVRTYQPPASYMKFDRLKTKEIHPKYYGIYDRRTRRAITPPNFAKAFFEANP